jgi:transketolase
LAAQRWQADYNHWEQQQPQSAKIYHAQKARAIPSQLKNELIEKFGSASADATRNLSGKVLQVLAKNVPALVGGSADLEPSNKTLLTDSTDIAPSNFGGKNIRFGVREHGMGAVVNGLAYTGEWIPYGATFLVFADYMRPAIRLAALSKLQSLFIFTHDSVAVGEDGPTHQPIEHIASLRIIPNLFVFRPADGLETALCYYAALQKRHSPSALLFTRQKVPTLKRRDEFTPDEILRGAYIVCGENEQRLVLIATGSEVSLACCVSERLAAQGVSARVVSMPCQEIFLEQAEDWRRAVLPPEARKVSIEAGLTTGWERVTGSNGLNVGIDRFGASAPAEVVLEQLGLSCEQVVQKILKWL